MIRNWVPASMIRIYGFHDEYKGRLAAFEKRIYPFRGWQYGQSDELFDKLCANRIILIAGGLLFEVSYQRSLNR